MNIDDELLVRKARSICDDYEFIVGELECLRAIHKSALSFFKCTDAAMGNAARMMASIVTCATRGGAIDITELLRTFDPNDEHLLKEMAIFKAACQRHSEFLDKNQRKALG